MELGYYEKIKTIPSHVCSNGSCSMAWYLRRKCKKNMKKGEISDGRNI